LKRSERNQIIQNNLEKYREFNQIYINDIHIVEPDVQYFLHPNADEHGILVRLSTAGLPVGKNILKIKKEYYSEKGTQKIVAIPFYFNKDS